MQYNFLMLPHKCQNEGEKFNQETLITCQYFYNGFYLHLKGTWLSLGMLVSFSAARGTGYHRLLQLVFAYPNNPPIVQDVAFLPFYALPIVGAFLGNVLLLLRMTIAKGCVGIHSNTERKREKRTLLLNEWYWM